MAPQGYIASSPLGNSAVMGHHAATRVAPCGELDNADAV